MAQIQIYSMVLGMVATNVFLVVNEESKEGILIDPADRADRIQEQIQKTEATPVAILLTHGHYDHMLAADELRETYQIPIYAEEEEEEVLMDPQKNLSIHWHRSMTLRADRFFREGEILSLAGQKIHVLHTPGHTQGSSCFYLPEEKILFSGDTLFYGSHGRIDFPTSSGAAMKQSIHRLLTELPEEVQVLPGHEMFTQIGFERKVNPLAP